MGIIGLCLSPMNLKVTRENEGHVLGKTLMLSTENVLT